MLLTPGPTADRARAVAALDEVERVHACLDHPLVPKVARRVDVEGLPILELDCDAVTDGNELVRLIAEGEERIPYAAADAFIVSLREALQAAAATPHPTTGRPLHLARISLRNVLFARDGRFYLVGFGRNFPVESDAGVVDGSVAAYHAPELASGGAPSLMGDYIALILFMRSLLPYVDLAGALGRVLRGELGPHDAELVDALTFLERRVLGQPPPLRATIDEAIASADRLRELLDVAPDRAAFQAFAASLLRQGEEAPLLDEPLGAAPDTLTLDAQGRWLAGPDGARRKLGRGLRGIVQALVARHAEAPGRALTLWELVAAGWPDEESLVEAGANRAYVSLTRLRAMGLRDVLERHEEGYRLRPDTRVRVVG